MNDVQEINEKVKEKNAVIGQLRNEISKNIVGQDYMINRLLIGLFSNGHILLEGVPGLAKTLAVTTLAQSIRASFSRIQFTPDLLPADLIGTLIYNPKDGTFSTKKGPIFANIILADEINRAPAKVQSALLEAMQEHQVTIGGETFGLDDPFLVLATQNPIEQEGTYPLPEAQVDIINIRNIVDEIFMDDKIKDYIIDVVFATREPEAYNLDIKDLIQFGASPRATLALTIASKAHAFLEGRGYVTPQDVKSIGLDVLRHRVIISYEAEAEEMTSDDVVQKIFDEIEVP